MRYYKQKTNTDVLCIYFFKHILLRFCIPTIALLIPTSCLWFWLANITLSLKGVFLPVQFYLLVCVNILTSICTVSIYHIIKTCYAGFSQINQSKYNTIKATCSKSYKSGTKLICELTNGKIYRVYGKKEFLKFFPGCECEIIIVCNDHGARMWEILLPC